jgi:hypothetical protein
VLKNTLSNRAHALALLYTFSTRQLPLQIPLQPSVETPLSEPIPKAHRHRRKKPNTKERRPPLIMIHHRASFPNLAYTPKIQRRAINQRNARYNRKRPGGRKRHRIAKVEQSGGDGAD